jgi:predicted RNA-binding Zn-ribbon protein involved in translation (DUF1610 family)
MAINKKTVCNSCTAEFFIEPLEDYPVLFCPSCGDELLDDEVETEDHDEE